MRPFRFGAFIAGLVLWPTLAAADSTWDHNGSTVVMRDSGAGVVIAFVEPKPFLRKFGIERDTVLFEGSVKGGGRLAGTAYVYKGECGPAEYQVEGAFSPGTGQKQIVLKGEAPVRAKGGCAVIGYTGSSPNSRLVFKLISDGE